MEPLRIRPTKTTPLVWFDPGEGRAIVAGRSLPENAPEFFGQLLAWLDDPAAGEIPPMRWEFKLPYFNTSSTKGFYQVLLRIKALIDRGIAHVIVWDVEDDDEFMLEAGQNFQELLGTPFEFRKVNEEAAVRDLVRLGQDMDTPGA